MAGGEFNRSGDGRHRRDGRRPKRASSRLELDLKCLDENEGAAFVVTSSGAIVYANEAAQSLYPGNPEWLRTCVFGNGHKKPGWVRRLPLREDGRVFWLLLLERSAADTETAHEAPWARRWGLPKRFARIAALILQGLTDKEIAAQTGLKLSTVRSYVKELLACAGVHSRARMVVAALQLV